MKPGGHLHAHLLRREVPSAPAEVDAVCREVRALLTRLGLASEVFPVEMLLRESLNNAMIHGNDSDCRKRIRVEVWRRKKWIVLRVTDEGAGFNSKAARQAVPAPDDPGGRGLAIYRLFAHRVAFNAKGNQVALWRVVRGDNTVHEFEVKRDGDTLSVVLAGDLTTATVPALKPALQQALAEGVRAVEFDVAQATIIDSTGIGLLIAAYNSLSQRNGAVRVVKASDDIYRLLQSMRLEKRLGVSAR